MDFLKELTKSVKPGHDESMERGEFFDRGDGIMEMMLKPTLATYESKDDKSKKSDDEDEDWILLLLTLLLITFQSASMRELSFKFENMHKYYSYLESFKWWTCSTNVHMPLL